MWLPAAGPLKAGPFDVHEATDDPVDQQLVLPPSWPVIKHANVPARRLADPAVGQPSATAARAH